MAAGLTSVPKELPPKYFYDARGSELFDEITRLPEYYPTRCERSILEERAGEIARLTGADTLVELGSGTSEKTHLLLDALAGAGRLRRIVAFDVSEPTLRQAAATLAGEYPQADVTAVVGDFEHHLRTIPGGGRRLVAFLGGTIGNLAPKQRAQFLSEVAALMVPGDAFLLGTDLVKDVDRLEAAYDDAAGVTAEFNRNVLHVVNRELGRRLRPGAASPTSPASTPTRSGSRCGCGRPTPTRSPSPTSTWPSTTRPARPCAPRSAPSSAGRAWRPSWATPTWP